MLQNPTNLQRTTDSRWYVNTNHTPSRDGTINSVTQSGSLTLVTPTNLIISTNPSTVDLPYNGNKGYPYKTTMDVNASKWLIYDKYNATTDLFQFPVEYYKLGTWSGENETTVTTKKDRAAQTTNRRSMW